MSSHHIDVDPAPSRTGIPRFIEATLAGIGILVCLPILLATAAIVWATSRGPILFRQPRVGLRGLTFTMIKFRTMRVNDAPLQVTAKGDPRITAIGRWLRLFKLDELPEIWNVLRGDMSLVGPRPEVPRYVDLQNPLWREVLQVRPGITDPVTLRLRNEESLLSSVGADSERFYREILQRYKLLGYCQYLRRRSFWGDVGVVVSTLLAVVVPASTPPPTEEEVRAVVAEADRE